MIVGYNHNVSYRGKTFHVQTEDSGPQRPQLVTLLYLGGTIISSKKTVYADIIKVDRLEKVVEELAREQHKGMLRSLTHGDLDQRIEALGIPLTPVSVKAGEGDKAVAKTIEGMDGAAKGTRSLHRRKRIPRQQLSPPARN